MLERLSDAVLDETVRLYQLHGSKTAAAKAAGVDRGTFKYRLKAAAKGGRLGTKPILPGFEIKQTSAQLDADGNVQSQWVQQHPERGEKFTVPEGQTLKRVSALTDADDRVIVKWNITQPGQSDPLAVADGLKAAFAKFKPAARPLAAPRRAETDLLTIVPCNDWHVGMYAWGKEVGENWDLKIAEATIGRAAEDTIARSPASGRCVILGGGDLLHADNSENKTARSGNALQVDGRYQKVVDTASRLMVRTIDAARRRHGRVTVRILPGNHDEHSAVAIAYFLAAWYRKEPRVTVDLDPALFWWRRFGKCLFGATHGHTVKIQKMPGIMAHRCAADWGVTTFRYVHGFHLHHAATVKVGDEIDGVRCEIHQAPIPQDAWHYGAGFLSGRSMQAITYHRRLGEVGRVRTAILDAGRGRA